LIKSVAPSKQVIHLGEILAKCVSPLKRLYRFRKPWCTLLKLDGAAESCVQSAFDFNFIVSRKRCEAAQTPFSVGIERTVRKNSNSVFLRKIENAFTVVIQVESRASLVDVERKLCDGKVM
jgi:hypothetical protein